MARRRGKLGNYLMTSDYSGITCYRTQLKQDYWGDYGEFNLKRNLQEVSTPLNDPYPVKVYRGPQYEPTTACEFETGPLFVGNTNITQNYNSFYANAFGLYPSIPDMAVGCTFLIYGPPNVNPQGNFILSDNGSVLTADSGDQLVFM